MSRLTWRNGSSATVVEAFCDECGTSLGADYTGQPIQWGLSLDAHSAKSGCTTRNVRMVARFESAARQQQAEATEVE